MILYLWSKKGWLFILHFFWLFFYMASGNKMKCLQKHSLCFFVCGMDNCVWAVSSFVPMTRDLIINADTAPMRRLSPACKIWFCWQEMFSGHNKHITMPQRSALKNLSSHCPCHCQDFLLFLKIAARIQKQLPRGGLLGSSVHKYSVKLSGK